ncbi:MAG: tetratricopeptide repeat protein, partial [Candidatus Thorarchaeota archaeon]|nr:tetratricopeptide repeat protein [Candidatus Thorarchaeota archaeon]
MDISKRIVVTFVVVALVPMLIISALSIGEIFTVSNANAGDAADALKAEELENLQRLSNDTALFIEERWQSYIDGVYMMEQYCEDLFNERISATPRYTYYGDSSLEPSWGALDFEQDPAVQEAYDSETISFDADCYFMPRANWNNDDPLDVSPSTRNALDYSSNMINVFKALHEMNPDYRWLYMGFDLAVSDQHLFRNYPVDDLVYFQDYYGTDLDYDANSEDWYTNVAGISPSNDEVIFTAPYVDPSVGLVISMGRPVRFDNGSLIGVVSADVTMGTVLDNVLNLDVSTNGYAFLLDSTGAVIAHRDQSLDDEIALIETLEFGTAGSSEATAFRSLLTTHVLVDEFGLLEYKKNSLDWHLSFVNIPNTDYILLVVVPDSDVIAPATEILNLVATRTLMLVAILGGILIAVGAVVSVVSSRRGEAIVEPIREMTRLVNKMAKQDFTRGVTTAGAMYEEVGTTVDALLSFQEACRFGNQAFIRGDLRRALANYQNLLEISKRLQIEAGEQTMLLNIGNVFRQRGDTTSAMDHYNQSIEISNRLLERAKEDGADEKDAMMRIASTFHNMALVEMDRGNADKAMTLLEDAEAID